MSLFIIRGIHYSWHSIPLLVLAALGCNPNSRRPPQMEPVPGAIHSEVELLPDLATQELADQLLVDSIPITVVQIRDAYLETPWFDAATGVATDRRPLGPEVVRVRAWIDPGKPNHSHLWVEVVYRPLADPSVPSRELDQQVPPDHPVTIRVGRSIETLRDRFGPRSPE